eukprot:scaffold319_cov362-Pavlova_lutheri.AAC.9
MHHPGCTSPFACKSARDLQHPGDVWSHAQRLVVGQRGAAMKRFSHLLLYCKRHKDPPPLG